MNNRQPTAFTLQKFTRALGVLEQRVDSVKSCGTLLSRKTKEIIDRMGKDGQESARYYIRLWFKSFIGFKDEVYVLSTGQVRLDYHVEPHTEFHHSREHESGYYKEPLFLSYCSYDGLSIEYRKPGNKKLLKGMDAHMHRLDACDEALNEIIKSIDKVATDFERSIERLPLGIKVRKLMMDKHFGESLELWLPDRKEPMTLSRKDFKKWSSRENAISTSFHQWLERAGAKKDINLSSSANNNCSSSINTKTGINSDCTISNMEISSSSNSSGGTMNNALAKKRKSSTIITDSDDEAMDEAAAALLSQKDTRSKAPGAGIGTGVGVNEMRKNYVLEHVISTTTWASGQSAGMGLQELLAEQEDLTKIKNAFGFVPEHQRIDQKKQHEALAEALDRQRDNVRYGVGSGTLSALVSDSAAGSTAAINNNASADSALYSMADPVDNGETTGIEGSEQNISVNEDALLLERITEFLPTRLCHSGLPDSLLIVLRFQVHPPAPAPPERSHHQRDLTISAVGASLDQQQAKHSLECVPCTVSFNLFDLVNPPLSDIGTVAGRAVSGASGFGAAGFCAGAVSVDASAGNRVEQMINDAQVSIESIFVEIERQLWSAHPSPKLWIPRYFVVDKRKYRRGEGDEHATLPLRAFFSGPMSNPTKAEDPRERETGVLGSVGLGARSNTPHGELENINGGVLKGAQTRVSSRSFHVCTLNDDTVTRFLSRLLQMDHAPDLQSGPLSVDAMVHEHRESTKEKEEESKEALLHAARLLAESAPLIESVCSHFLQLHLSRLPQQHQQQRQQQQQAERELLQSKQEGAFPPAAEGVRGSEGAGSRFSAAVELPFASNRVLDLSCWHRPVLAGTQQKQQQYLLLQDQRMSSYRRPGDQKKEIPFVNSAILKHILSVFPEPRPASVVLSRPFRHTLAVFLEHFQEVEASACGLVSADLLKCVRDIQRRSGRRREREAEQADSEVTRGGVRTREEVGASQSMTNTADRSHHPPSPQHGQNRTRNNSYPQQLGHTDGSVAASIPDPPPITLNGQSNLSSNQPVQLPTEEERQTEFLRIKSINMSQNPGIFYYCGTENDHFLHKLKIKPPIRRNESIDYVVEDWHKTISDLLGHSHTVSPPFYMENNNSTSQDSNERSSQRMRRRVDALCEYPCSSVDAWIKFSSILLTECTELEVFDCSFCISSCSNSSSEHYSISDTSDNNRGIRSAENGQFTAPDSAKLGAARCVLGLILGLRQRAKLGLPPIHSLKVRGLRRNHPELDATLHSALHYAVDGIGVYYGVKSIETAGYELVI